MSKITRKSQLAVFVGTAVGSVIALFGLTKAASAAPLSVSSSFAPMLGEHVAELARILAAPDQTSALVNLTQHQWMLLIVSIGFIAMVAGSAAFWNTLQRDFSQSSNRH